MARRKTWAEKRDGAPEPHVSILSRPWMGAPAGGRMFIASPRLVQRYMDAIPRGETRSVVDMRAALAREAGADIVCPTSTGIFVRIVAEAALDEMNAGAPAEAVAPFWRLIDPESPAAAKLSCGSQGLRRLRAAEQAR